MLILPTVAVTVLAARVFVVREDVSMLWAANVLVVMPAAPVILPPLMSRLLPDISTGPPAGYCHQSLASDGAEASLKYDSPALVNVSILGLNPEEVVLIRVV